MAKKRYSLPSEDVITTVYDEAVLEDISITWDENEDPVVSATYLVPGPDGKLMLDTRISEANAGGFINSVFNDTA